MRPNNWPAAGPLPGIHQRRADDRRAEQLTALEEAWRQTQLTGGEPLAIPMPPSGSTGEVALPTPNNRQRLGRPSSLLDNANPLVELFDQMAAEDVRARRAAARRLADLASDKPLDEGSIAQLVEVAMAETDPLVWRELLRAIKDDSRASAARMAYVGASHAAADVRRLSCGYLAVHSDPAHAMVLLRLLDDPNRAVVLAAIEAMGVPGAVTDPVPLERLQGSDDGALRVAAARSLAINGFVSGSATLARLTTDADAETRREAVAAMGQLRDVAFSSP